MHTHNNNGQDTAPNSVDVVFALTGDPKTNSRALRQLHLLSKLNLSILVLGLGNSSGKGDLNIENASLRYLPKPAGKGPRFFWRVHQLFDSVLRNVRSTVYHASDLYTLPAMHRAASRHQAHLVFDSRELYTHLPASIRRPWVGATWKAIQRLYIRRADCVYTVSESIAQHLQKHFRLNTVHLMRNVPRPQSLVPKNSLREHLDLPSDAKIVLHQGNLQQHRGGAAMVEAMQYTDNAVLVFMGGGPLKPEIQRRVNESKLGSKIRFMDAVPPDQLLSFTASADIGLTFLEDCCLNHRYALPNKLFEYLAAGIPVIASSLPEIAQIIERFDVGCVVPSGDAKALGNALDHAINNPELRQKWSRNTPHVQEFFNFATESEHFLAPYRQLVNK
ncbi:MAG: glycosyltransferase family 4 protein [Rhodothermaceae bacterium]|nr:glycosyltransferase family 4 protein [Rhodothermaceae bacterium]MYC04654.1 glycosyltransferase family 4 protein [Rhodothermaceae bacterium]MYI17479.1 glycosyltransferase family 4 protein [Rhodothermaceae bacterium]